MPMPASDPRAVSRRDLHYFTHPNLWSLWPFLPVVRRKRGCEPDLGVLYDCLHVNGRTGFSAAVFLTNLFTLPKTEAELFALPREVFDTAEEMAAAGWVVD